MTGLISAIPELFQTLLPELIQRVRPKDAQAARVMQLIQTIGAPMWRHPSAFRRPPQWDPN